MLFLNAENSGNPVNVGLDNILLQEVYSLREVQRGFFDIY